MMKAEPVDITLPCCELGEGPHWDVPSQSLFWVDIKGQKIHRYWPDERRHQSWEAPQAIAFIIPQTETTALAGLADGVYTFDLTSGTFDLIARVPDDSDKIRLNDGKCDPSGRLWIGTMARAEDTDEKPGKLYSFEDGFVVHDDGFQIANGKGWSRDAKTMYHADTTEGCIRSHIYDLEQGTISGEKIFIDGLKSPDGICVDGAGNLYIALYGGSQVVVYDERGTYKTAIDVAAKAVTSCALGGAELKTLYITTAATPGDENGGQLFQAGLAGV